MYGCKTWQGIRLIKRDTFNSSNVLLRWWDLSVLQSQQIMFVRSFVLTINVCFLWLRKERDWYRVRQRDKEKEIERKRTVAKEVTSCVNFSSNSLKGYIKLYHDIQPPWNNLYANKALHMVRAVVCGGCSSAGKIFYVVSEFCGSQMFFNL